MCQLHLGTMMVTCVCGAFVHTHCHKMSVLKVVLHSSDVYSKPRDSSGMPGACVDYLVGMRYMTAFSERLASGAFGIVRAYVQCGIRGLCHGERLSDINLSGKTPTTLMRGSGLLPLQKWKPLPRGMANSSMPLVTVRLAMSMAPLSFAMRSLWFWSYDVRARNQWAPYMSTFIMLPPIRRLWPRSSLHLCLHGQIACRPT